MVTSNKVDFTIASSVVSKVEALLSQFHDTESEIAKSKEKSKGLMVSALALLVPHMIENGTGKNVIKELRKVIRGGKKAEKIAAKDDGLYFSKSTEDKVLALLSKKPFLTECKKVQDLEKLQEYFITNHKCNGFNAIYALYHPVDEAKQIERLLKQIAKFKDTPAHTTLLGDGYRITVLIITWSCFTIRFNSFVAHSSCCLYYYTFSIC